MIWYRQRMSTKVTAMSNNKTALVTGGAKGIGAAICRRLAKDGYNIAINYNTSEKEAQLLKTELQSVTQAEIFKADVSDSQQVNEMFDAVCSVFGSVDVLVNNAGIAQQILFTDITDECWNKMLSSNLSSAFYCSRAALKGMISRKCGAIVNIASMWGEVGASLEVHYSASKAGLIGLTKALAKEVGPSGITVNSISPGVINTDMMSGFSQDDVDALCEETPLCRVGEAAEVADAVAFLVSDNARFITGQNISVNGGFVI